jgi:hypothetical protein
MAYFIPFRESVTTKETKSTPGDGRPNGAHQHNTFATTVWYFVATMDQVGQSFYHKWNLRTTLSLGIEQTLFEVEEPPYLLLSMRR